MTEQRPESSEQPPQGEQPFRAEQGEQREQDEQGGRFGPPPQQPYQPPAPEPFQQPQPGQQQFGQPYGQPGQQPYAQPGQQQFGQPGQQPYGQPGQQPYGQPGQQQFGQPGQQPYGEPGQPYPPPGQPGQQPYGQPGGQPGGAWAPPPQAGPGPGGWTPPPTSSYPSPGTTPGGQARPWSPGSGINFSAVDPLDWGSLAAGVLMLIFSFFDFWVVSLSLGGFAPHDSVSVSYSGWHPAGGGFFGWFGIILGLAAAAVTALAVFQPRTTLPISPRLLALALFAAAVLCELLALFVKPGIGSADGFGDLVHIGHGFSYWVCFILSIAGTAVTFLRFQRTGGKLPGLTR